MMQVLPKWKVTVKFGEPYLPITIWLSDTFVNNVVRKVSDIDFTNNLLIQPKEILIESA